MTKCVNITLTVDLDDNGEKGRTAIQSSGLLTEDENGLRLWYTEPLEEGSVVTEVRVVVTPRGLTIHRSGLVSSTMALEVGKEARWEYQTPYGKMEFPVVCSELSNTLTLAGGRIFAKYCVNTSENLQGILAVMEYLVEEVQE